MRISLGTRIDLEDLSKKNGYGYATDRMLDSLTRLGHAVKANDEHAPVQIWFDQPHYWKWREGQYNIGYHPWESSRLQDGWVDKMNQCDEIWTPSPLIAKWYKADGVDVPVYVYQHGVDDVWKPREEEKSDKIRFLHVGGEAARKGGWDALRAFRLAFPNNDDVEFTMKLSQSSWNISRVGKTNIINTKLELEDLVKLYQDHDVYIYPSSGEGFGLTPLQAMACGMPTITVPAWAPYKHLLNPNLNLPSSLKPSPWPKIHPGKVFRIAQDDVIDRLRWVYDNYDDAKQFAMDKIPQIKAEYDWDSRTKDAFGSLEKRLKN